MPFDPCDPCCNPAAAARSVDTYRQAVLIALCQMAGLSPSGSGNILTVSNSFASAGDNQVIPAPTDGTTVHVVAFSITAVTTTALTAIFQDDANVELWRDIIQTPANVSGGANLAVPAPAYLFKASAADLGIDLNLSSAITAHVSVSYFLR